MHWNYRVVRKEYLHIDGSVEEYFGIHEVYYEDDNSGMSATENPIAPDGETIDELKSTLTLMLEAFNKPVLDYDKDFPND